MPEGVYDRCRTTELFEGGVLCQIGFKPAFSALLILLGICPNRADKAEVSGSSALRPTLARCP